MESELFSNVLRKKQQNDPYAGINPAAYSHLTSNNQSLKADFKPLNFDNLLTRQAVRVTHQGSDGAVYNPDPSKGFSLVSGYNDALDKTREGTRAWPDNPMFHNVVREMFGQRPHDIGAHKYLQIVQSARDMGMSDDDIFMPPPKQDQARNAAIIDALRKRPK